MKETSYKKKDIINQIIVASSLIIISTICIYLFSSLYSEITIQSPSAENSITLTIQDKHFIFVSKDKNRIIRNEPILHSERLLKDNINESRESKYADIQKHRPNKIYLLYIIIIISIIGCFVRSMYDFIGHVSYLKDFNIKTWWPWYLLRPCIAACLGVFIFVAYDTPIYSEHFTNSHDLNTLLIIGFLIGFSLQDMITLLRSISKHIFFVKDKPK